MNGSENRPTAVLVSKQRIVGPTNGSSVYVLSLARTIEQAGFDVCLVQPSPDLAGRTPILHFAPELDVFAKHEIRGLARLGNYAIALAPQVWTGFFAGALRLVGRKLLGPRPWLRDRPRPYSIALPWNDAEHRFVRSFESMNPALIIADYVFGTDSFSDFPATTTKAVIMHDLFCRRDGKGEDSVTLLDEASETALLARADWIIAIQQEERDFAANACPDSEVILAGMPAKIAARPQPGGDDNALFIGSDTAPNVVGLRWFFAEVWPMVRKARPGAKLDIVGTVGRRFGGESHPGVTFHGLVDDLDTFYREAGVLVSPLTFGSGLKIKLIEALGQAKAVVATPITLQGVEDSCAQALVCEEEPEPFAQELIELLGNRSRRAELAGLALACAKDHFSAESVHGELIRKLAALRSSLTTGPD